MCSLQDAKQCCQTKILTCFTTKPTFHFSSAYNSVFCEAATESVIQNGTEILFAQSRQHFMYNHQNACILELCTYFRPFKRLPADAAGNVQILNYNCHIAWLLFFQNFIFRFKSIHFIIDTQKYPHDSTTRYEQSRRSIRLDFQMSIQNSKKIKKM